MTKTELMIAMCHGKRVWLVGSTRSPGPVACHVTNPGDETSWLVWIGVFPTVLVKNKDIFASKRKALKFIRDNNSCAS